MDTASRQAPGAVLLKKTGRIPYREAFARMKEFTAKRLPETRDELWMAEHEPVFTLGQGADLSHVIDAGSIPVVRTDRGGEVTYHGPGQAVAYLLFDLKRRYKKPLIHEFVSLLEEAVIQMLASSGIAGERRAGAPGVYIPMNPAFGENAGAKIAALGLKVGARGYMYHGLSLNVAMDLSPFKQIDPCGYPGLPVTDMRSMGFKGTLAEAEDALVCSLSSVLGFETVFSGGF